ncbi:Uncharacterised protein [Bordetella ansorpii]|uniref:3-deoxy-D-arabino-heptulosonate 7-phosphate synthase n=1 Tax=Bordetella ansorpii TaxID=288768 RepID=A0A157S5U9_9BORD|nr:3-deoxy-D-arabino-heptulosonate 7-phosphate synthase [Bordetella ansorpii]SAI65777.1 Uncharacterised protein [Bordetella ansorpii]
MPASPLLEQILRNVARRYRLPALDAAAPCPRDAHPATVIALAIERARQAHERGHPPDAALKRTFVEALGRLIQEAMRAEQGDPGVQAMALRHQYAPVREYALLAGQAEADRRAVHAVVNAIAHPAKLARLPPGPVREGLHGLQQALAESRWTGLHEAAQRLAGLPDLPEAVSRGVDRLRQAPALGHLRRQDVLAGQAEVHAYLALSARSGPRPGSEAAMAEGRASRRRGDAVEAATARAMQALAGCLGHEAGLPASYRVVTSMRVPASIPASQERAKTEWDAVLLRQAGLQGDTPLWDVCLLAEAKASADAAPTDLPRLVRGLRLLAHADAAMAYGFEAREGRVLLRGASLAALRTDPRELARQVLYCCQAPVEPAPRLLGAASRMQLLCAPPSLEVAAAMASGQPADLGLLEAIWDQLPASPHWAGVFHQYPALEQVRNLMVHPDDLRAAAAPGRIG